MNIADILLITTILALNVIVHGQFKYCVEFVEPRVFAKCEEYPDNYIDQIVDMSEVAIHHTEDGDLIVIGPATMLKTLPDDLAVKIESFKKERGAWQPTVFTSKRSSFCKSAFDKSELWSSYWKDTPAEQLSCPFTEGQRIDMNISSEIAFNLPMSNIDGEYKSRMEIGDKSGDIFLCTDVFVIMHRL